MKDGRIVQVAAPLELYNHPANLFVAGFIGSPQMNFFPGTIQRTAAGLAFVETNLDATPLTLALTPRLAQKVEGRFGVPVVLGIRPENVRDATAPAGAASTASVTIDVIEPMGAETFLYLRTGATNFVARVPAQNRFTVGATLPVAFDLEHAHLFDAQTEQAL
jgi:multiple sugar transport system ATP-binding protein